MTIEFTVEVRAAEFLTVELLLALEEFEQQFRQVKIDTAKAPWAGFSANGSLKPYRVPELFACVKELATRHPKLLISLTLAEEDGDGCFLTYFGGASRGSLQW